MHKSDNDGNVGSSRAAVLLGNEEESFQVSSSIQTPVTDSGLRQPSRQNLRTANEIRTAISASENTRICCSIAAAILVLLSYTGFPFLGWGIFRSIICFRPLYLLLITNISIVVARLLLERKGSEERQTSSVPSVGGDGMIDQVSKALELGLLMQKIVGALFMDCSIYAVVLVCGLSTAQRLGW
ncbi:Zinc finger FYVE domain-containing 26 isoform 1 [Olea europaea subsp. europaea]|uniref:Zinc finger FYVE domain-containing 26 isoform 1 n=1 Tax=Olea europaea subsp. europaea TaxID=158383 RepID=A0A8S0Q9H1_OLEEU|nr:Zinc finger FYVE domain-containing 26 isoform 1 [Olea europaea subsp. europaea]